MYNHKKPTKTKNHEKINQTTIFCGFFGLPIRI